MIVDSAFGKFMHDVFGGFDMAIFAFFGGMQNDVFTGFAKVFTAVGSSVFFVLIFLYCAFLLFYKRPRRTATVLMIGLILVLFVNIVLLKYGLARIRPYNVLQGHYEYFNWYMNAGPVMETPYCFPSGHSACSMCIATILFFVLKNTYKKTWAWMIFLWPFFVGCSRVYLMVHYATDVIAGWIIGILLGLLAFALLYLVDMIRIKSPKLSAKLENWNLEKRYIAKHGKPMSTVRVMSVTIIVVLICTAASFGYFMYEQGNATHRCQHQDNNYVCMNKGSHKVLDSDSGEYKYYCELHDK